MANQSQQLLEKLADQSAELDDVVERRQVTHRQRFVELQRYPEERDPVIWFSAYEALLGDMNVMPFEDWFLLDAEDFASMPDEPMKAILWQANVAACKAQSDVDVIREVIGLAEKHSKENAPIFDKLSTTDAQAAASEGIGNDRFKTAKERRSNGD